MVQGVLQSAHHRNSVLLYTRGVVLQTQEFQVYKKLRVERMNARMEGARKKRAEEEAAAEKDKA